MIPPTPDLAIYEAIAAAALRRCGSSYRKVRRALAPFEDELRAAKSTTSRLGLAMVVQLLRARLDELRADLPAEVDE